LFLSKYQQFDLTSASEARLGPRSEQKDNSKTETKTANYKIKDQTTV